MTINESMAVYIPLVSLFFYLSVWRICRLLEWRIACESAVRCYSNETGPTVSSGHDYAPVAWTYDVNAATWQRSGDQR